MRIQKDSTDYKNHKKAKEERYNKFLHGLDNNHVNSHYSSKPLPLLSDAELQRQINELTPKIKNYKFVLGFFGVIAIIFLTLARFGFFPLGWLIGFIFLIPTAFAGERVARYKKRLKCIVSNNIVRGVLNDKFELSTYAPGAHIPQLTIQCACLLHQPWNKIKGSDLVKGSYKGVNFTFSDLHLQHETGSGKNRKVVTRFKGQWLIIDLAKKLPFGVQLKARNGDIGVGKRMKSDVETENIEFNQKFQITAPNPLDAFLILTPHFMEYILKAKHRASAQMYVSFDETQIHVALHNGRDLFEPADKKLFAENNIETLRMQMRWDVNYIANIIDEFLLNEVLFNADK
ncbi:MAG: DUF3137 domain-containing protein [Oscillospiraceae bacterium]|nr:DUF3137 domain-containing protein [Oscillospiraceae bacterium]